MIIHLPLEKIWKHLGQFGGLDIKTSQELKLSKNWKIGHFKKNPKWGHYSAPQGYTLGMI